MVENEKLFESKIESYLISEAGGWQKADDSGYCNHDYRGMALDIVTLTDFVKASQPMAWRRFERMCTIDPVRQFYKAFDSAVQQDGLIDVLRHGFKHRGVQFTVCYFAPESTLNELAVSFPRTGPSTKRRRRQSASSPGGRGADMLTAPT